MRAIAFAGPVKTDVYTRRMSSAFEASFHKIARLDDLPLDEAKTYRAAGTTVILRRTKQGVVALNPARPDRPAKLATRIENGDVWVCIEACET